ncbi:hypothetical protein [Petrachloros mirabilis]
MIAARTCCQLVILLGVASLVSSARGDDVSSHPFWTEQAMFRFGDEMFFAGRASCAPSVEAGRQQAYEAAVQEIRNFTRTNEIAGVTIETQMVYEAPESPGCAPNKVNVWRLLRVQIADLERLVRRARSTSPSAGFPSVAQAVRDRTLQVGMSHDQIWERVGQPRSISIHPQSGNAVWDYPQFGLILLLDEEERLKSWKLMGAHSTPSTPIPSASRPLPHATHHEETPPVDLTGRLQVLEDKTKDEHVAEALHRCANRFPKDLKPFDDLRSACERHAYERFGRSGSSP